MCGHCVGDEPDTDSNFSGAGFFVLAGLPAAAGIGLLVAGAHHNAKWREWKRSRTTRAPERRLHVGAGGLSLRFGGARVDFLGGGLVPWTGHRPTV